MCHEQISCPIVRQGEDFTQSQFWRESKGLSSAAQCFVIAQCQTLTDCMSLPPFLFCSGLHCVTGFVSICIWVWGSNLGEWYKLLLNGGLKTKCTFFQDMLSLFYTCLLEVKACSIIKSRHLCSWSNSSNFKQPFLGRQFTKTTPSHKQCLKRGSDVGGWKIKFVKIKKTPSAFTDSLSDSR